MREGPLSGSFGGGRGSGKNGMMLNHLEGSSSTESEIWFSSKASSPYGATYYVWNENKDFRFER